jgi:hypothetical protein
VRRLFALAGAVLALVGFTFAASAQQIDNKTYCTDGKELLWRPPGGDLVPVTKFKLEREVVLTGILIAYPCKGFPDVRTIVYCLRPSLCRKQHVEALAPGALWFTFPGSAEGDRYGLED